MTKLMGMKDGELSDPEDEHENKIQSMSIRPMWVLPLISHRVSEAAKPQRRLQLGIGAVRGRCG